MPPTPPLVPGRPGTLSVSRWRQRPQRPPASRLKSTCILHQVDRSQRSQLCQRSQSALGTQYLYFRWRQPIRWASMHRVEFVLPNLTVSFFVRDLEPVLRNSVIDRKTYVEHLFWQDNRCMIVRRRPDEPDMIVLQHSPDFQSPPLTPPSAR